MGKRSRDKGARRERQLVKALGNIPGVHAERVPLSGAAGGSYTGDIRVEVDSYPEPFTAEVKARANAEGWQTVKKWLANNDFLFLVEDRKPALVLMPLWVFDGILSAVDHGVTSRLDLRLADEEEE